MGMFLSFLLNNGDSSQLSLNRALDAGDDESGACGPPIWLDLCCTWRDLLSIAIEGQIRRGGELQ